MKIIVIVNENGNWSKNEYDHVKYYSWQDEGLFIYDCDSETIPKAVYTKNIVMKIERV